MYNFVNFYCYYFYVSKAFNILQYIFKVHKMLFLNNVSAE